MKKLMFVFIMICGFTYLQAQSWTPGTGLLYSNPVTTKVGIGVTTPTSKLELGVSDWMKFNASSSQSGLLFYETGTSTANDVRYGAKIYYDETKDLLQISTKQDGVENFGIAIIRTYGRVGIGLNDASKIVAPLCVKGSGASSQIEFGNNTSGTYIKSYDRTANTHSNLYFYTGSSETMVLTNTGNVGIGCSAPTVKLAVNGKIQATEMEIKTAPCSDFVFEADYKLLTLSNLEQFIKTNKHLPEIPSAAEFEKNGYNVGEMDDLLLRKVEELTLYIIEQEKRINSLEEQLNAR